MPPGTSLDIVLRGSTEEFAEVAYEEARIIFYVRSDSQAAVFREPHRASHPPILGSLRPIPARLRSLHEVYVVIDVGTAIPALLARNADARPRDSR